MAVDQDIIRLTIDYSHPNATSIQNVFTWQIGDDLPNATVLEDMENWTELVWGPEWAEFGATLCSIVGITVDILNLNGTVKSSVGSSLTPIAGLRSGSPMPAQDAPSIFGNTALPRTRGRKFLAGFSEDDTVEGVITGGALGNMAVLLALYLLGYNGEAPYMAGVLSTVLNEFVPFALSGGFDNVVDNQTRRRPDRGG